MSVTRSNIPIQMSVLARMLLSMLAKSGNDRTFSFSENEFQTYFAEDIIWIVGEVHLIELAKRGHITYDVVGEEGFVGQYVGTVNTSAYDFLRDEVIETFKEEKARLNQEIERLKDEKKLLLEYDPERISSEIRKATVDIEAIKAKAQTSGLLDGIKPVLNDISVYLDTVQKINDQYENVYLNVIKPIKKESQNGVRATAFWAIVSIVLSSIASVLISNWGKIMELLKTLQK